MTDKLELEKTTTNFYAMFTALMEQLEIINTRKVGIKKQYKADVIHKEKQDLVKLKKLGYKVLKGMANKDNEEDYEDENFRSIVDFYHESASIVINNLKIK